MLHLTGEYRDGAFVAFELPLHVCRVENRLHAVANMELIAVKGQDGRWLRYNKKREERVEVVLVDDAVATKLDLARAYIDFHDASGAKHLLEEVMAQGNDQQKDEARELFKSQGYI